MTSFARRSHIRLLASAMLLLCWLIAPQAQETAAPMPDIWGLRNLKAPQTSNETPRLNDPAAETLAELSVRMEGFRSAGYAMPSQQDLSTYSEDTLNALLARAKSGSNDCVGAIDMALFLDAHIAETSWAEALQTFDNPSAMFTQALRKIYIADGLGDGSTGFLTTNVPGMQYVDMALKINESLPIINEHNIGSIAAREGIWTQEIFEMSQKSAWDEAKIKAVQVTLLADAKGSSDKMASLSDKMAEDETQIELRYGRVLLKLEEERAAGLAKADAEAFGQAIEERRANVEAAFTSSKLAALKEREKALFKALEDYESAVNTEELRAAKYQVQYAALSKYARPIAQGKCEEIAKQGLLAQPEDPRTPEEKQLDGVIELSNDKLMLTLGAMGITPSQGFLNCLCKTAGYGSPGTSQTYHPDTIGTYDPRYSCQHPGDPCVVSGYGCTRHPLPTDRDIWKSCAASNADAATPSVTDAIAASMAKRAAEAAAKAAAKAAATDAAKAAAKKEGITP